MYDKRESCGETYSQTYWYLSLTIILEKFKSDLFNNNRLRFYAITFLGVFYIIRTNHQEFSL